MLNSQSLKNYVALILYILLYIPIRLIEYFTHQTAKTYLKDIRSLDPDLLSILHAKDIKEICAIHGFSVHEHVVKTDDGYLLAIHRIYKNKPRLGAPVVYFHHGLLTNSELFVLGDSKERSLPFVLVEMGYDVWLGNNRGNKYSRKHLNLHPTSKKFWDFSMDEFAIYDIPNTIEYVLDYTEKDDLTYVGFSQGSAQLFATLSVNPKLRRKINKFIGLSPAMIPRNLNVKHPIVDFFINSSPNLLFMIFGSCSVLPSVVFWQRLFGNYYYEKIVDYSLKLLFDWNSQNISANQKLIGYPHMFSTTSVKTVVHWFQVIKDKSFTMYNNEIHTNLKLNRCVSFPIETLQNVPMVLIYGTSDLLIDIEVTKEKLQLNRENIKIIGIKGYEHMDLIWGKDVERLVFNRAVYEIQQSNPSHVAPQMPKSSSRQQPLIREESPGSETGKETENIITEELDDDDDVVSNVGTVGSFVTGSNEVLKSTQGSIFV